MSSSFFTLPGDGSNTGPKIRTRERVVGGNTINEQYVIVQDERVVSNFGKASSFATSGRAATGQTILCVENKTGSGLIVELTSIKVFMDVVAALTTRAPVFALTRGNTRTNGDAIAKAKSQTALTASTSVEVYGDASADDTSSASALSYTKTDTTERVPFWRAHTLVGQLQSIGQELIKTPLRLLENQVCAVDIIAANAGDNPITNRYWVNIEWLEFTLP